MELYEISQYRNICTSKFYELSYETLRNITSKICEILTRQNFTNYHMKLYEISHRKFAKFLHVKIFTKYHTKLYEISYETLRNTIRNFTKYHLSKFIRQNFTKRYKRYIENLRNVTPSSGIFIYIMNT